MEFKLFTDLIDALGKVAGGLKALVNLPKAEREAMHRTLNMVIIRLGDILRHAADADFLREASPGWTTTTNGCRQRGSSGCAAVCAWPCARRRRWPESWPAP